jgi:hypothetical protein
MIQRLWASFASLAVIAGLFWVVYRAYVWIEESPPFLTGRCTEKLGLSETSPDGRYVASLFERNCGATVGLVPHVNLRARSREFVVDRSGAIKDGEVVVLQDPARVELAWKDGAHLTIKCPRSAIFRSQEMWNDVVISYEDLTP